MKAVWGQTIWSTPQIYSVSNKSIIVFLPLFLVFCEEVSSLDKRLRWIKMISGVECAVCIRETIASSKTQIYIMQLDVPTEYCKKLWAEMQFNANKAGTEITKRKLMYIKYFYIQLVVGVSHTSTSMIVIYNQNTPLMISLPIIIYQLSLF